MPKLLPDVHVEWYVYMYEYILILRVSFKISQATVTRANGVAVISTDLSPARSASRTRCDALSFKEHPAQPL